MNDPERCKTCNAPHEVQVKWDGGRLTPVSFPTCNCEDDALDAAWEAGRLTTDEQDEDNDDE